jgi:hypothetical protein
MHESERAGMPPREVVLTRENYREVLAPYGVDAPFLTVARDLLEPSPLTLTVAELVTTPQPRTAVDP